MKKLFKLSFVVALLLVNLAAASNAVAGSIFGRMDNVAKTGGYEQVDEFSLAKLIGQAVSVFLGLLGVIFVVLVVFAGYNWMTAGGDSAKVEKAKDTLWRAVIGLVITVGAYAIWRWVFFAFV